jgi:hypothetical protein
VVRVSNTSHVDLVPDVAYDATRTSACFVWEYAYSASDHDVYAELLDSSGAVVAASYIDISSNDWRNPKVANNNFANNFLVVADASIFAGARQIMGRTLASSGAVGAMNTLSAGALGEHVLADVGGDFYDGSALTFFGLVWQRNYSATDTDILFCVVDTTGARHGGIYYLANTIATFDKHPSISKGTGDSSNYFQGWNIAFDHQATIGDRDIWGRPNELGRRRGHLSVRDQPVVERRGVSVREHHSLERRSRRRLDGRVAALQRGQRSRHRRPWCSPATTFSKR